MQGAWNLRSLPQHRTLVFWRAGQLRPVAHYNPVWPEVAHDQAGLAEFEVGGFGHLLRVMSVQWRVYRGGDVRLDEARKLTRFAASDSAANIAGDFDSLWPDCAGHQEFEPGGTLVSDRRALTVFADAGFRSAGCIANVMTPTVNEQADIGHGGRIDHIVLSRLLAGCVIPAPTPCTCPRSVLAPAITCTAPKCRDRSDRRVAESPTQPGGTR
jgi:hypothetical protein